jgi:hypothetical protein
MSNFLRDVYQFARAAITKYHRYTGLNNRNVFSHISEDCKFKVKAFFSVVSSEASPHWLVDGPCLTVSS